MKAKLVTYLRTHRREFLDLRNGLPTEESHTFGSVPGYISKFQSRVWIYLTKPTLDSVIGRGKEVKQLKEFLADKGILATGTGGTQGRRFSVERPIFAAKHKEGYQYVYAIRISLKSQ